MMHYSLVPLLIAIGLLLNTQWFMQDGASPHSKHCFGLPASHFWSMCDFPLISCLPWMWTEVATQ
jgi:hypothetical protein